MKNLMLKLSLACLGLWALGCVAGTGPQVDQVFPLENEPAVDATIRSLTVTYNGALEASSVQANTIQLFEMNGTVQGAPVAGTTSYDSTYLMLTFELAPSASLQPDTTYQAVVNDGLKANDGLSFDSSYSWTFTTGGTK